MSVRDEDKPLTPDLQALLADERAAPGPDGEARARVAARLTATLGVALGPLPHVAPSPPPLPTTSVPPSLPGASSVVAAKAGALKLTLAVVGALAGGGALMATWMTVRAHGRAAAPSMASGAATVAPSPPLLPPAAAPPAPATPAVAASPVAAPAVATPAAAVPPVAAPAPSAAPGRASRHRRAGDLAAERALVAAARDALRSGDAAAALDRLADHASRFPRGQLSEERDALRVRALAVAGDRAAARAAADAFARRHPDSLFLPSVRAAVTDAAGHAQ